MPYAHVQKSKLLGAVAAGKNDGFTELRFYIALDTKIGHFREVLPNRSLSTVAKTEKRRQTIVTISDFRPENRKLIMAFAT